MPLSAYRDLTLISHSAAGVPALKGLQVWHARADGQPLPDQLEDGVSRVFKGGRNWLAEFVHEGDRARVTELWRQAVANGTDFEARYRYSQDGDGYRWVLGRGSPLRDASGTVSAWVGTILDIDGLAAAEASVEIAERQLALLLDQADYGTWEYDLASGRVRTRIAGNRDTQSLTESAYSALLAGMDAQAATAMQSVVADILHSTVPTSFSMTFRWQDPDRREVWYESRGTSILDSTGKTTLLAGVYRQVNSGVFERPYPHFKFERQPQNRMASWESLEPLLAGADAAALGLIVANEVPEVLATFGLETAEGLLDQMTARLQGACPNGFHLCRWETGFVVVQLGAIEQAGITKVTGCLQDILRAPYRIGGHDVALTVHAGTVSVAAPITPKSLLVCADLAVIEARQEKSDCPIAFEPRMREAVQRKHNLLAEISRATSRNEFTLFYQPQVRLSDGQIVGVEALLRWQHPERGLLTPADFLAPLKQSSLAIEVGNWVLGTAIADAANLARQFGDIRTAVNLFSKQFRASNLAEEISRHLTATGLPPTLLELEITEQVILTGDDVALDQTLSAIRALGCTLSFDDFGTGYASLSALKQYPIDRLKIDRSFVQSFSENARDDAIVDMILLLGEKFGLSVIAEGIEDETQAQALRAKGCTEAQGYHFGRPMPFEDLVAHMHNQRAAVAV